MRSWAAFVLLCLCSHTLAVTSKGITEILGELWDVNLSILKGAKIETSDTGRVIQITEDDTLAWCFCGTENWLDVFFQKNKNITDTCYGNYSTPGDVNVTANYDMMFWSQATLELKQNLCAFDCMFRRMKLITSRGTLNRTLTRRYFMEHIFKADWIRNTAGPVVNRCLNNGGNFTFLGDFLFSFADNNTCSAEPGKFILCLMLELTDNCPDNRLSQGMTCQFFYYGLNMAKNLN